MSKDKDTTTTEWEDKTRGGYPVRILATDIKPSERADYSIAGVVTALGFDRVRTWRSDGRYSVGDNHEYDLIPKKRVREWWIVEAETKGGRRYLYCSENEETAREYAKTLTSLHEQRVTAIKRIEITEGEGI